MDRNAGRGNIPYRLTFEFLTPFWSLPQREDSCNLCGGTSLWRCSKYNTDPLVLACFLCSARSARSRLEDRRHTPKGWEYKRGSGKGRGEIKMYVSFFLMISSILNVKGRSHHIITLGFGLFKSFDVNGG